MAARSRPASGTGRRRSSPAYDGPGLVNRDPIRAPTTEYWFQLHEKDHAGYVQANFKGRAGAATSVCAGRETQEDIRELRERQRADRDDARRDHDLAVRAVLGLPVEPHLQRRAAERQPEVRPDAGPGGAVRRLRDDDAAGLLGACRPDLARRPAGPAAAGVGSGTGRNPDLKPIRSTNLDAGLEWYFAKRSLLSARLFYMDLHELRRLRHSTADAS